MRKIISSLDIGSDSIKLVVCEILENRFHILCASKIYNHGMENGKVIDSEVLKKSIKKAVEGASNTLGIEIKKVILGINSINTKLVKTSAVIKIKNDNKLINGEDISNVIQKCADGKVDEGYVLIGVLPIYFITDGNKKSKDPKGIMSENLGVKSIVITTPKRYVNSLLNVTEESGLKVVDIVPNCLGDYYTFKTKMSDNNVGAVINLGNETTTISIFNRGILTNVKTYKAGSKNIVNDIAFVNKIDDKTSKAIFSDIVLASSELANPNEYRIVTDLDGKEIKINQYDASDIAERRIEEILNLAKKQINLLTKKEISYIIVSGGLTELKDFNLILENVFGKNVYLGNLNLIGARDNSYVSAVGIIKYFDKKILLRGKTFSIFTGNELNEMYSTEKNSTSNNTLINKVFGYFFDS